MTLGELIERLLRVIKAEPDSINKDVDQIGIVDDKYKIIITVTEII